MTVQNLSGGVADVRAQVSAAEWNIRVELAACYRLIALYGWTDLIYNHISATVPGEDNYLLNPFGLNYSEITASSLIKVDIEGNIVFNPDETYGVNLSGFIIHGAIHAARPDLTCVLHTHTVDGMAMSTLKCGFLPLVQSVMRFPRIAYHDYEGLAVDTAECERLVQDLGDAEVMVLRNHGLLAGGATIAQAFNNMYRLERASQVQLKAMATNSELVIPPETVVKHTNAQYAKNPAAARNGKSQPMGMLEWPALLRILDQQDPSYKN
jgi:ribulose-5-phosphate 4-epimerase/fuculose-1-phosphate aldolase